MVTAYRCADASGELVNGVTYVKSAFSFSRSKKKSSIWQRIVTVTKDRRTNYGEVNFFPVEFKKKNKEIRQERTKKKKEAKNSRFLYY